MKKRKGLNLSKEDIEVIDKYFEKVNKLKKQYNLTAVEAMNVVDEKTTLEEVLSIKKKKKDIEKDL